MTIRLKISPKLTHLAPAIEIIIGIRPFLKRDNFGDFTAQEGKGAFCIDYSDCHIVLVQHQNAAGKP
jgi:hypothetical protein